MSEHDTDGMVPVAVKTPMMPRPTTAMLPGQLTVTQAVEALRSVPPKDANASLVIRQLERETAAGSFDFLAITGTGDVAVIQAHTTLNEIAVPKEVRTPAGLRLL